MAEFVKEADNRNAEEPILVSAKDGWTDRLRRSIPSNRPRDIFSDGLVTRPSRGHWRISPAGRDYLQSIEHPFEYEEAAE